MNRFAGESGGKNDNNNNDGRRQLVLLLIHEIVRANRTIQHLIHQNSLKQQVRMKQTEKNGSSE